MSVSITGHQAIDRRLKRLATTGQRRVGRAMVGAMMTEISRGIRNAIPPSQKSVKKTLGRKSGKDKKTGVYQAKVGLGVGKRSKSSKQRDPKKPGVGISKQNVHWFILGTTERVRKKGGRTGRMPKAPDWVKQGYAASRVQAVAKAQAVGRRKVFEEARK